MEAHPVCGRDVLGRGVHVPDHRPEGTASDDRKPYHESGIGYLGHLRLAAARSGAVGARDLRLRADVRRDRARAAAGKAQGAGVIIIIWFVNKAAFA